MSTHAAEDAAKDIQNPTDIGWQALAPALALNAVALALVLLRWCTRLGIVRKVGVDDVLLSCSMVLSIGMSVGIAVQFFQKVQVNVGKNDWGGFDVVIAPTVAKVILVNNVLYATITNLTKCSIVVQYLRLFSQPRIRIFCHVLLVLLVGATLYGIFAGLFICRPIRRFWRPDIPGHCFNANRLWLAGAGINIVMDWAVWITPMPVIGKLKLPRRQFISVIAVFALGGFICATSVTRLCIVHIRARRHENTKAGVGSVQWSAIEANVGIICASLMAIKPLILRFCPSVLTEPRTPRHAMQIRTIESMESQVCWGNSSLSTTCAVSEPAVGESPGAGIRVTLETKSVTEIKTGGVFKRLSGLWAGLDTQAE